jgi:hypothetical protein
MIKESELGVLIPEVLLPDAKINMKKWSVVACDQFTSEPEYWYDVQRIVGNAPSTLNLILPEAFINENDRSDRVAKIKNTMKTYVESGALAQLPRGVVLVERTFGKRKRKGVMLAIDLDKYDFLPGNKSLIRATEKTVLERIPPRMEVRRGAILETPHAMLLMNDEKDSVIGPLYKKRDSFFKLYGFELMQDGGYLNGWFTDKEEDIQALLDALGNLKARNEMLFAVGDGNHSLVTAKAIWEEEKERLSPEERETSPLKYALVEVVNLYDPALKFEPIHRVLFGVSPSVCINELVNIFHKRGLKARIIYSRNIPAPQPNMHILPFVTKDTMGRIEIQNPESPLESGTLQDVIDEYLEAKENVTVDYIHGDDVFMELIKQYNTLGFKLPTIAKEELFPFVYRYGILPQKCFSMGDSMEKRYYTECRLLVKMETEKAVEEEPEAEREPVPEKEPPAKPAVRREPPVKTAVAKEAPAKAAARRKAVEEPEEPEALDEVIEFEEPEEEPVPAKAEPAAPEITEEDLSELNDDMILHFDDEEEGEDGEMEMPEEPKKRFSLFKKKSKH